MTRPAPRPRGAAAWVALAVAALVLIGAALAGIVPARANGTVEPGCAPFDHEGARYVLCHADARTGALRLWHRDPQGRIIGSFERLEATAADQGLRLIFAMNAGMYHPDRAPVGLYIEDGAETSRLLTGASPGNFGMLPNGVFCIGADRFAVIESRRFARERPACRHATQSGPMLLIDGALHPRFIPQSPSRLVRNGVGVSPDGRIAWLAISQGPVNFDEFARMFRDGLGVRDALYLDGNVSRLFAPELGRRDGGRPLGPFVGAALPLPRNGAASRVDGTTAQR